MKIPETCQEKEEWLKKELVGHEINGVKVMSGVDGSQSVFLLADDRTIQIKAVAQSGSEGVIVVGRVD